VLARRVVKMFRLVVCNAVLMASFDRGFGPGVVRSKNFVDEGVWNKARLHYNSWNGYVQLNDGRKAWGRPKVSL